MNEHRLLLAKVQSQQFQAAFERCWNVEKKYDLKPEFILGMPALICAALSVEIGIKALLAECGNKPPKDHNLRKLLNALPTDKQEAIKSQVSKIFPDYETQLSNAEKAFVVWRYFYEVEEQIEVNILFVGELGSAVQNQIGLEWKEVSE